MQIKVLQIAFMKNERDKRDHLPLLLHSGIIPVIPYHLCSIENMEFNIVNDIYYVFLFLLISACCQIENLTLNRKTPKNGCVAGKGYFPLREYWILVKVTRVHLIPLFCANR